MKLISKMEYIITKFIYDLKLNLKYAKYRMGFILGRKHDCDIVFKVAYLENKFDRYPMSRIGFCARFSAPVVYLRKLVVLKKSHPDYPSRTTKVRGAWL